MRTCGLAAILVASTLLAAGAAEASAALDTLNALRAQCDDAALASDARMRACLSTAELEAAMAKLDKSSKEIDDFLQKESTPPAKP